MPVVTAKVAQKDVPVDIAAIGNVEAYSTISVRSQVTGILTEVLFHEGDFVKKGQLLFTLDPRPFEAPLAAGRSEPGARRGAARARPKRSWRATPPTPSSRSSPPSARAARPSAASSPRIRRSRRSPRPTRRRPTVKADRASIDSARAQLVAQQAAVDNAECAARLHDHPVADRRPHRQPRVKVGNLVTANQTELMTIAQVQPVLVTFSVPAIHLADDQAAHGRRPAARSPRRRRTPRRSRRPAG